MAARSMQFRGVQLASEYRGIRGPALIEPKLDGYRLPAIVQPNGAVVFYSRTGHTQPYNTTLDFLARELEAFRLEPGTMLDGEILVGDWNTTGLVRKTRLTPQDKANLLSHTSYWAFDLVSPLYPNASLEERKFLMGQRLRQTWGAGGHVMPVPWFVANSQTDVDAYTLAFLQRGYEGSIVKNPRAPYTFRRDANWQKIKRHKTFEVMPTGYVQGTGKYRNTLGVIQAVDPNGNQYNIGTGFSDKERHDLWARKPLGKRIEVRMQDSGSVDAGRPLAFIRFREDDDRANPSRAFVKKTYKSFVDHVSRLGCDEKRAKAVWRIAKDLDTEPVNLIQDPNTGDQSCHASDIKNNVETRIKDCDSYPRRIDPVRLFIRNAHKIGHNDFMPMSMTTARKRAKAGECYFNASSKSNVAEALLAENGIIDDPDYNTHRVDTLLRTYAQVFGSMEGPMIAQALIGVGYGYKTLMDAASYIPYAQSNIMRLVNDSVIPTYISNSYLTDEAYTSKNMSSHRSHMEELKRDPDLMKYALLGLMGSGRHRRRIERLFATTE